MLAPFLINSFSIEDRTTNPHASWPLLDLKEPKGSPIFDQPISILSVYANISVSITGVQAGGARVGLAIGPNFGKTPVSAWGGIGFLALHQATAPALGAGVNLSFEYIYNKVYSYPLLPTFPARTQICSYVTETFGGATGFMNAVWTVEYIFTSVLPRYIV